MDEEMKQKFARLIGRRGVYKGMTTKLQKYFDSFDNVQDMQQLQVRLSKYENLWQSFMETQEEIELLDPSENQFIERESFENNYYRLVGNIKAYIESETISTPQDDEHKSIPRTFMAPVPLPKFNGDPTKWLNFKNTFEALVHENKNFSPIQKFHCLKGALEDTASNVIESITISALNYTIAWSLVQERYENKQFIIDLHISGIIDYRPLQVESHRGLRTLYETLEGHLRSLEKLGIEVHTWDYILVNIIVRKFDEETRKAWESSRKTTKEPALLEEIKIFMKNQCNFLERIEKPTQKLSTRSQNRYAHKTSTVTAVTSTASVKCDVCAEAHMTFNCEQFLNLTPPERFEKAKQLHLCINCLKPSHKTSKCKSSKCKTCQKLHNTLLHFDENEKQSTSKSNVNSIVATSRNHDHGVVLATALVELQGPTQRFQARVLLDSGSQSCLITRSLCEKYKLVQYKTKTGVQGINCAQINISNITNVQMTSKDSSYTINIQCLVLPSITAQLPTSPLNPNVKATLPRHVTLADPSFDKPGPIDLLIGANVFYDILSNQRLKLPNGLVAQSTSLGWIIAGGGNVPTEFQRRAIACHSIDQLHQQITQFWQTEEGMLTPAVRKNSIEEQQCEDFFEKTTLRDIDGKYIVRLPFRDDVRKLGQSRAMATQRFLSNEKKRERQPNINVQYQKFIQEYNDMGHMEKVPKLELDSKSFFLPHHHITQESSQTTKLRVVFDGSAKTTSSLSLNDLLMVGPTLQKDLFDLIIRFRTFKYVLSADITKMYRMIKIHKDDQDMQRILWRKSSKDELEEYRLTTVTYGTASAPYLAIKALRSLAKDEGKDMPDVVQVLLNDFYVDDLLTGGNSHEELLATRDRLIAVLGRGGFQLNKWCSNHPSILQGLSPSGQLNTNKPIINDNIIKTLGVQWDAKLDQLLYKVNIETPKKTTKRTVLSQIAKLYDPLGLLGPVVLKAKSIMQSLWALKLSWDEPIPEDLESQWNSYIKQLSQLETITTPRYILNVNTQFNCSIAEIHAFCDASKNGYGACLYIRHRMHDGKIEVKLLCSKARVSPLKTISIPRLELCGMLVLARLANRIRTNLAIPPEHCHFWSDSTVALSWIAIPPTQQETYIANRITEIQQLTKQANWYHINTRQNPADLISRGAFPSQLIESNLWWHGPEWLSREPGQWPTKRDMNQTPTVLVMQQHPVEQSWLHKYSSFEKLVRIAAFCLRFKTKLSKSKYITIAEYQYASKAILKFVQREQYGNEIKDVQNSHQVKKTSTLRHLDPFLDSDGLLRVKGRLENSLLSYNQRHPIILPKHHVSKLIFEYHHKVLLHSGAQTTLTVIRLTYWPINGLTIAKQTYRKCIKCAKVNPRPYTPYMGNLPAQRITPSRPFTIVGIDFAGPYFAKEQLRRKIQPCKVYLALFICFATKAVHLEMVTDLTTAAFLAAFNRFSSRRGCPTEIYSDNGRNFVGAHNEMIKFTQTPTFQNEINHIVTWKFIPPVSPHFGGIWEASIKSAKTLIKRVIGVTVLTFEELQSLFVRVEACLNSRPLTSISSDESTPLILTPGHFLIGAPITAPPETNYGPNPMIHQPKNRWEHLQLMMSHFWKTWSQQYLHSLQTRQKWNSHTSNPKPGDIILMMDNNNPPLSWKMGIIKTLHPGNDGVVRVATIQTSNSLLKRSLTKLCPLPISSSPEVLTPSGPAPCSVNTERV